MKLELSETPVPDRVSLVRCLEPHEKHVYAELGGPGCIRHIFVTSGPHPLQFPNRIASRKLILRIYFDDQPIPIDNHYLSVKAWKGNNPYFLMPFAKTAWVEIECRVEQRSDEAPEQNPSVGDNDGYI